MRFRAALALLVAVVVVLVGFAEFGGTAEADAATPPDERILVLDDDGAPRSIRQLELAVDPANKSVSVRAADSVDRPFWLYANESWLREVVPYPAFDNVSFAPRTTAGARWLT